MTEDPGTSVNEATIHNPDRFMVDLRQILSQGRKRIGLLIGAGAPVAIKVNSEGKLDDHGQSLIPDVASLTKTVIDKLDGKDEIVINRLLPELGENPNVEIILTRVRRLAQAIGSAVVYGLDGTGYESLAERICKEIGTIVAPSLPREPNPYTELISWIGGTDREHPIEIFTPNYDLLIEEAFERARLPYFDGFSGTHRPFFDSTSIVDDSLPVRWSRLWKIHGSLGWEVEDGSIVRTGSRDATTLIYPDHLKYDQITRQPYSALFDRLHDFLATPDSLLLCTGFSFSDAHIKAVLEESLSANTHTAIFAFQHQALSEESNAVQLALRRPNVSVYASDGAVIRSVQGRWQPGQPPTDEWESVRGTFWKFGSGDNPGKFLLGDFAKLARFFALAQASEISVAPRLLEISAEDEEDSRAREEEND